MSIYANLSKTVAFEKAAYFDAGLFLVKIVECRRNIGGAKGDSFIIETEVVAVKEGTGKLKAGQRAAHVWSTAGGQIKEEMAIRTLMSFLCAVLQVRPTDKTDEEWLGIIDSVFEQNILEGTVMRLECTEITTKAGNPFTKHRWLRIATEDDLAYFDVAK